MSGYRNSQGSDYAEFESIELDDTPFFAQTRYHCGPAALATVLNQSGVDVVPDELVKKIFIPGREGSLQSEILASARKMGRMPVQLDPELAVLQQTLVEEKPVLVLQNYGTSRYPVWHYAVLVGYNSENNEFILRSGTTRRKTLTAEDFSKTWNRAGNWAIVLLDPGEMISTVSEKAYLTTLADFEQLDYLDIALSGYRVAALTWPESELAWVGMGNAYYKSGDTDSAESAYRHAVRVNRYNAVAYNNLATVLLEKGCMQSAMMEIRTAENLATNKNVYAQAIESTRKEIVAKSPNGIENAAGCL